MDLALLLIDLQNDYFPGGKMELHQSEAAGQVAGRLLAFFREHRWPVIQMQHLSIRPGATFFIPQTWGAEIHACVRPQDNELIIQKHFPNSFRETPLLPSLQQLGIKRLVIAGMMTHMCVDATARAAVDLGYECRIAQDGCATRDLKLNDQVVAAPEVHTAFLAALNGAYGRVATADTLMAELRSEMGHTNDNAA